MVNTHITTSFRFDREKGEIVAEFWHDDIEVFVKELLIDLPKDKQPTAEFYKEEIIDSLEKFPEFFFPPNYNLEVYSDEAITYECFGEFSSYWWEGDLVECSFIVTSWTACLI